MRTDELTNDSMSRFIGGQLEVQVTDDSSLVYRGEIGSAAIEDGYVRIRMKWMAKRVMRRRSVAWVDETGEGLINPAIDLRSYSVSELSGNRLSLTSSLLHEAIVLFPPGGSELSRSEVEMPRRKKRVKGRRAKA